MQVDADEAGADEALPGAAAADVKRVAAAAAGAALEQCKGKIPVREGYFSAMDLGADAGAPGSGQLSDINASESDLDVVSEAEGMDGSELEASNEAAGDAATRKKNQRGKTGSAHGSASASVLESGRESLEEEDSEEDESESEGEDDGGYGEGGLSWQAVMAQVMGGQV